VGGVVDEVEDGGGVDGVAHVAGLEVEMGTGAATGAASKADGLSRPDSLPLLDQGAVHVAVDGL